MRRIATAVSVVAVVLLSAGLFAQAGSNFSGKWEFDVAKNAEARAGTGRGTMGGRGASGPMIVEMDSKRVTFSRMGPDGTVRQTFMLDGSETRNITMFRGREVADISKASFRDGKLSINTAAGLARGGGEKLVSWYMIDAWLVNETEERTVAGNALKYYYKRVAAK